MRNRPIAWITGGLLIVCFGCAASKTQQQVRTKDVWNCYSPRDYDLWWRLTKAKLPASKPEIIVVLTRWRNKPGGQVWASGSTWTADYGIEGINRRWDFGDGRYAVILQPDGAGRYYDFTFAGDDGKAEQRNAFQCERR